MASHQKMATPQHIISDMNDSWLKIVQIFVTINGSGSECSIDSLQVQTAIEMPESIVVYTWLPISLNGRCKLLRARATVCQSTEVTVKVKRWHSRSPDLVSTRWTR